MDAIFHEKQEGGRLCAQHALNALLQDDYYSADVLAGIALQLESEKLEHIKRTKGEDSDAYRKALNSASKHFDDTGYFSLDVLKQALSSSFSIRLVRWEKEGKKNDPLVEETRKAPEQRTAYICNHRNHWITLRKFGTEWFDLNSLLPSPKMLTSTELSDWLHQLVINNHYVFIVDGQLPPCKADGLFTVSTQALHDTPQLASNVSEMASGGVDDDESDRMLQLAIQLSIAQSRSSNSANSN